jgi:hypothetical protein
MFSFDGHGSSDTNYGAGSSQVAWWTRPDITHTGAESSGWEYIISSNANKYFSYYPNGKIVLDFSSGSEAVTVSKW